MDDSVSRLTDCSDSWWYVKIYHQPGTDSALTDRLLLECVDPLTKLAESRIERFFFLRYFDRDGHHLRLRIQIRERDETDWLHAQLNELLAGQGANVRVVGVSYEPEVDKYGGAVGVRVAERHFHASSRLALECIRRTVGRNPVRALVAVVTFDRLLRSAGLDDVSRARLLGSYRDYWSAVNARLMGAPASTAIVTEPLQQLDSLKGDEDATRDLMAELVGTNLSEWEQSARQSIAILADLQAQNRLTVPLDVIVCNLAHTFHNRLGLAIRDEVIVSSLLLGAI
jgi:thiopeptide-type bacteriocin biosynthesis protein